MFYLQVIMLSNNYEEHFYYSLMFSDFITAFIDFSINIKELNINVKKSLINVLCLYDNKLFMRHIFFSRTF